MAAWPPDIAALIHTGRAAFRPQRSDRDRILQSLTRALGEGSALQQGRR
jgi:hypothetical protein